jgi:cold shock CspA family protein
MNNRLSICIFLAVSACTATAAPSALAFGGTAQNLEHKGNFVVTNNAGFGFTQQLTNPTDTTFTLRPALDYFVIDHLSLGGAVGFDVTSPQRGPSTTSVTVAPDVGYATSTAESAAIRENRLGERVTPRRSPSRDGVGFESIANREDETPCRRVCWHRRAAREDRAHGRHIPVEGTRRVLVL